MDASRLKAASIFALLPSSRCLCPSLVQPFSSELWCLNPSASEIIQPVPSPEPLCPPSSLSLCLLFSLRPLSVSSAGVSPLTAVHSSSLSVGLPRSDTCALFSRTCTLTLFLSASLLMRVANFVCPPPSLFLLPPLLAPPSLQCFCRQLHVCSHRQCFSNVSVYAHLRILNIATKSPRILSACEVPPLVRHRAQDGLSYVTGFASLKPAWDVFKGLSIFNRFESHSQPILTEILRLRGQNDSKFDFRH